MNYWRALAARQRALAASRAARVELGAAVDDVMGVWQAHPVPVLVSAAGVGFVLAQLHMGQRLLRTTMRIASGPGWRWLRRYLGDLG